MAHREDGHDPVTVDVGPGRVDGQAPVGVAVVRDAEVGAVLEHRGAHEAEVRGSDAVVDVEPVRAPRPIATTSAPARRYTSGATAEAAPWAQSTTTRSPSSGNRGGDAADGRA